MNDIDFTNALRQTLADRRLTGSEKHALKEVVAGFAPDDRKKGVARHLAFDVAKEELADPKTREVLDWLEEVVKLLLPASRETEVESHFNPGEACTQRVLSLLGQTRRKADLCVFTITDDRITQAILEAHKRGIAVRIISDDEKSQDLGSDMDELARQGVPVRLDDLPAHMHHKFALFDDSLLATGSYNWTRGASYNMENLIVLNDPRLIASFQREFDKVWEMLSR